MYVDVYVCVHVRVFGQMASQCAVGLFSIRCARIGLYSIVVLLYLMIATKRKMIIWHS